MHLVFSELRMLVAAVSRVAFVVMYLCLKTFFLLEIGTVLVAAVSGVAFVVMYLCLKKFFVLEIGTALRNLVMT